MRWIHMLFLVFLLVISSESVVLNSRGQIAEQKENGYSCYLNVRGGQLDPLISYYYTTVNVIFLVDDLPLNDTKMDLLLSVKTLLKNYYNTKSSFLNSVDLHDMTNIGLDSGRKMLSNLKSLMNSLAFKVSSNICFILTAMSPINITRAVEFVESVQNMGMNLAVLGVGIDKNAYIDVLMSPNMVYVAEDYVQEPEDGIKGNGEEMANAFIKATKEAAYLPRFIHCYYAFAHIFVVTDIDADHQDTLRDVRKFGVYFDRKVTVLTAVVLNTAYTGEPYMWSSENEETTNLTSKENILSGITYGCQQLLNSYDANSNQTILMLAVDRLWSDISDLQGASTDCQKKGIHVMVLGVGQDIDRDQLKTLVSDQRGLEMVDKDDDLTLSIAKLYKHVCVDTCPGGWASHSGSCFKYEEGKQPWLAARDRCSRLGASLVSVTTSSKHYWLQEEFIDKKNQSVFIGLRKYPMDSAPIGRLYRWLDGKPLVFTNWNTESTPPEPNGATYEECVIWGAHGWEDISCSAVLNTGFICEMKSIFSPVEEQRGVFVEPLRMGNPCKPVSGVPKNDTFDIFVHGDNCASVFHGYINSQMKPEGFACTSGELVSRYLLCDGLQHCQDGSDEVGCDEKCSKEQFLCDDGRCVSFANVCDFWDDCGDNSDENKCSAGRCSTTEWRCGSGQCISIKGLCDMHFDCYDRSDEEGCTAGTCKEDVCEDGSCLPWSWLDDGVVDCPGSQFEDEIRDKDLCYVKSYRELHFIFEDEKYLQARPNCTMVMDGLGKRRTSFSSSLTNEEKCDGPIICPVGFYRCPNSYCIPIENVCDGNMNCINGEDEVACASYNCPGYFRCPNTKVCIHPALVCDGEINCPGGRDEIMCNFMSLCPENCSCYSGAIQCDHFTPNLSTVLDARTRKVYVTDSDLSMGKDLFTNMSFLWSMSIVNSKLSKIRDTVTNNINLRELNISMNKINAIPDMVFSNLKELVTLDISYNPIENISNSSFAGLGNLMILYMKYTSLVELKKDMFKPLSKLEILDIEGNSIVTVRDGAFRGMTYLKSLYFQGNPITYFTKDIYTGTDELKQLHTSVFSLCCIQIRPKSLSEDQCISPKSSISSCDDLLNSDILRSSIWVLCIASLLGNVVSIPMRVIWERPSMKIGYGVFVTHLGIADFLMGIYLFIIAIADVSYMGNYIWNDHAWRNSGYCKLAGVLSTFSSEASMMFICFITIDRYMVIKFPFSKIRFRFISATLCSTLAWVIAGLLATIPLLPSRSHWQFYSQSGACLALPYATERRPGWLYSAAIYVGFNFVAFTFTAIGQLSIYREVRSTSMIKSKRRSEQEMKIAKRLILIVATDFLCWFPIGVMSILALAGVSIGGEAFVWTAVFILPVNSALNPFVYTIPAVMQSIRRQKQGKEITSSQATESVSVSDVKFITGDPGDNFIPLTEAVKEMKTIEDKITLVHKVLEKVNEHMTRSGGMEPHPVFLCMRGKVVRAICLSRGSRNQPDDIMNSIYSVPV